MPSYKPLVIINGRVGQLPAGDTLNAQVSQNDIVSLINGNAGNLVIGTPVYVKSAGTVDKAQANAVATTDVIGLVMDPTIATAVPGNIQTDGVLTATTAQWDAVVTGESGGLTPGSRYYLSDATAGMLTTVAPTNTGSFFEPVGIALSPTQMQLDIDEAIFL